jgi:hypothetical protein
MSKKKTPSGDLPALKIGSRVRCTDDGVLGKIASANGVSVKIRWEDGEEVTWKRDSLPTRPIEILDADDEAEMPATAPVTEQVEQPAIEPAPEQGTSAAPVAEQVEQPTAETAPEQGTSAETPAPEGVPAQMSPEHADGTEPRETDATVTEQVAEALTTEAGSPAPEPTDGTTPALAIYTPESAVPAKPKRDRKPKTEAEPKEKKMSAIDAAARVLAEAGVAMTCKEMVAAMATKGYWSSPGGKTPDATLCSAILREIKLKGEQSRFVKTAPGRFASRPTV